jgi:hypothetical protein
MKDKRWKGFSTDEPSESSAYIRLNIQTPCPPRSASRSTKHNVGGSFTLITQFAFGYGCDLASYVGGKIASKLSSYKRKDFLQ